MVFPSRLVPCLLTLLGYLTYSGLVAAFSNSRSDNLAVYWGQDSAGHQERLSFYCDDDTIDIIPLAFLYIFFGKGGQPVIDFANTCSQSGQRTFPGTDLADCSFLAPDIQKCQAKGKIVTISLGGGSAKVGLSSDAQASSFADTIWNMFLGGQSDTRPLGNAVLDGIDLDIESGSAAHYATFVDRLRTLSKNSNKKYYVTAAPQCPFPDASIGAALNSAPFDAVYVQFYNNFCETSAPSKFNFDTWDNWAKTQSPNPNVKVFLGAPAAAKAAGEGYVDIKTLAGVAKDAQKRFSSFGGVMLWDADEAYTNNRYDVAIKNAIRSGPSQPNPPPPPSPSKPPTTSVVHEPSHTTKIEPSTTVKTTARPTPTQITQAPPPPTSSATETVVESFRDPRATARVRRPSHTFTFDKRDEATPAAKPLILRNSRFFRF